MDFITTLIGIFGIIATLISAILSPYVGHLLLRQSNKSPAKTNIIDKSTDHYSIVMKRGFVVCGVVNHPPMCFLTSSNGNSCPCGIYGSLVKNMEILSALPFHFVDVSWDEIPFAFTDKGCDLVLSVFETSARLRNADFVAPFYTISLGALVARDNPKIDLNCPQLTPYLRYVVCKGEAGSEHVLNDLQAQRNCKVVQVTSSEISDMIYLLHSKTVDVAIADNVTFRRHSQDDPSLAHIFVQDPLFVYKNSIMVPKNDSIWSEWIEALAKRARACDEFVAVESKVLSDYKPIIRRIG
jgi:ABC-type amino acid transport substrate-binding protein